MTQQSDEIAKALAAPFTSTQVRYKPGAVSGNRALAMPYVDARAVMGRLDEVLGIDGWHDSYEPLADGTVICRLSCRIGGEWIEKADVGEGKARKDAFSGALKRAAVKFGIGRYLYAVKATWRDYDPRTKQLLAAKATEASPAEPSPVAKSGPPPAKPRSSIDAEGYPVRRSG